MKLVIDTLYKPTKKIYFNIFYLIVTVLPHSEPSPRIVTRLT